MLFSSLVMCQSIWKTNYCNMLIAYPIVHLTDADCGSVFQARGSWESSQQPSGTLVYGTTLFHQWLVSCWVWLSLCFIVLLWVYESLWCMCLWVCDCVCQEEVFVFRGQRKTLGTHLCYYYPTLFLVVIKYSDKLREERLYFSSQLQGTVHHIREVTVAGAWRSWS